jgi:uncharacterized protein YndB with AHSA1/START domain
MPVTSEARSTEVVVDIAATTEEVWQALTEADQLVQWFPLQAEVRGGVGGEMVWEWDGSWSWRSEIERWDPKVALTLVNRDQRPFDVEGKVSPEGEGAPATLKMEFTLETVRGKTRMPPNRKSGGGWLAKAGSSSTTGRWPRTRRIVSGPPSAIDTPAESTGTSRSGISRFSPTSSDWGFSDWGLIGRVAAPA